MIDPDHSLRLTSLVMTKTGGMAVLADWKRPCH